MKKSEIKAVIAAKIAGQGNQVDIGSALPVILSGILDLLPDEIVINIAKTGSVEGQTTTYDITTVQADIDNYIADVQGANDKAAIVVLDKGAAIRFTQIEVSDNSVTAFAAIAGGSYTVHLAATNGGKSYFRHTKNG